MWSLRRPRDEDIAAFLDRQRALPLSYGPAGATRSNDWPAGFDHDRNSTPLGHGPEVFARGAAALRAWHMFPARWTRIVPAGAPQREGGHVALLIRVFGVWWLNAARIVYEENRDAGPAEAGTNVKARAGFAYGTLPGHVESGEERFTVTWYADDSVCYEIHAFSRPRHWLVRIAKPLARRLQRRFVRQSLAAMRRVAGDAPQ